MQIIQIVKHKVLDLRRGTVYNTYQTNVCEASTWRATSTPEVTVEKILDAAQRLFLEKGYENTTIQDIVGELGGLTKGAVYHHFKSKEEIMDAVKRPHVLLEQPVRGGCRGATTSAGLRSCARRC